MIFEKSRQTRSEQEKPSLFTHLFNSRSLKQRLQYLYQSVVRSIAFYPTLVTLGFILLALLCLRLEAAGLTSWLDEHFPVLVISQGETGRALLNNVIQGLISLIVFSFSMVMIVLSQAINNFSPRLIPGLISSRSHQIVLGAYLGTVVYCIMILMNLVPNAQGKYTLGFSVFLGVVFGIGCLGLFVYFIHSISTSLQVNSILSNLYHSTLRAIENSRRPNDRLGSMEPPDGSDWHELGVPSSGYINQINLAALADLAGKVGGSITVKAPRGGFVLTDVPLVLSRQAPDEATGKAILQAIPITRYLPDTLAFTGFKYITEIAVKAMSPGINDPGTALTAIDYLADLLAEYIQQPDYNYYKSKDGGEVYFATLGFRDFLFYIMAELRQYTKHDTVLVRRQLLLFQYLLTNRHTPAERRPIVLDELNALLADADRHIDSLHDRRMLRETMDRIREDLREGETLYEFEEVGRR